MHEPPDAMHNTKGSFAESSWHTLQAGFACTAEKCLTRREDRRSGRAGAAREALPTMAICLHCMVLARMDVRRG